MKPPSGPDPLDEVLKPPPGETLEQRELRLQKEEEARKISLAIDASIKAERQARRKKRIVRLLLLGQSESGKSTTLRQFQRLYTPTAFREERILWRAVIQLNIIRSIRTILDAVSAAFSSTSLSPRRMRSLSGRRGRWSPGPQLESSSAPRRADSGNESEGEFVSDGDYSPPSPPIQPLPSHSQPLPSHTHYRTHSHPHSPQLPPHIEALQARLAPLFHVEQLLIAKLVPPNEEEATQLPGESLNGYDHVLSSPAVEALPHEALSASTSNAPRVPISSVPILSTPLPRARNTSHANAEVFVRPGQGFKGGLSRARVNGPSFFSGTFDYTSIVAHWTDAGKGKGKPAAEEESPPSPNSSRSPPIGPHKATNGPYSAPSSSEDESQQVLHSLCRDMNTLWHDPWIRELLKRKKIRLEEESGFFLNDLERVTNPKFLPSDDDVLRARLKTVGVCEYKFEMEVNLGRGGWGTLYHSSSNSTVDKDGNEQVATNTNGGPLSGGERGTEWRIVDVGGSRSQRATWIPFFDDVDAIIFLAPISGFDQVLAEDRSINRLEDSVLLWKDVCSNKLLANVELILFLNKCDILDAKLKSGIRLSKYIRNYGDRENNLDTASKYLRSKFSAIHREYSPSPRKFYAFCTSVTDTATTAGIIASVRDMVIRRHLKQSKLL